MNLKEIIDKLNLSHDNNTTQVIMLGNDAAYIASKGKELKVTTIPFVNGDWEGALVNSLNSEVFTGNSLQLIVCAKHYQVYQVEKPNIPESEWSEALPFLLKDLVSEREITASAVALPGSNKLQVYILAKKILDKLIDIARSAQVELKEIVPEDEVWCHSASDLSNFILLQRSPNSNFKLRAFVEHTIFFQRTIRGVESSLIEGKFNTLQLESLALDLQRSIDYLSSQIKDKQLNQLKICCDDVNEDELQIALNNTLSPTVSLLIEGDRENTENLLVQFAAKIKSFKVNLYPEYLKPRKDYFSLANLATIWVVIGMFSLGCLLVMDYQTSQIDIELTALRQESNHLSKQINQLNSELTQHKPSLDKVAAVDRLKREYQAKRETLNAVSQYDESMQVGYSNIMNSLAQLGRSDLSLSHIYMTHDTLDLSGLAQNANVIPNWVGQFKNELNLVGRSFEKLIIGRNEQDIVTFELNTRRESK